VTKTAFGLVVPWRDAGSFGPAFNFLRMATFVPRRGRSSRPVAHHLSGFFAALGVPIIAGRDFNQLDGQNKEPVVWSVKLSLNECSPIRMPSIGISIGRIR